MSSYRGVIIAGALSFPFFALLALVPYMVYEYRRYGSIPAWKSFVVFSLILYGICAYYLVILPLPKDRSAYVAYAATPDLVPFQFVGQFAQAAAEAHLSWRSPASWVAFLSSSEVYITLFNLLLTAPVGFYAHYLFDARAWQATLAGFLTSLFFELTQLTGLYGIYAHPYRLFDVNDLIVNTAGALFGYVVTLPVCRALPRIDDVNARARERGRSYPSVTRRALALAFDLALACALTWVARRALTALTGPLSSTGQLAAESLGLSLVLVVLPPILGGATLGQRVLSMRLVEPDGDDASPWRVLARQLMLWWGLILLPRWVLRLFPAGSVRGVSIASVETIIWALWLGWALALLVRVASAKIQRRPLVMLNAWASGTRLMSLPEIEALRAARAAGAPGSSNEAS